MTTKIRVIPTGEKDVHYLSLTVFENNHWVRVESCVYKDVMNNRSIIVGLVKMRQFARNKIRSIP